MSALAIGLILSKPRICVLRRGDAARHAVVFQCVVSADYDLPSARPLLRTLCKDGRKVKQPSCACKTMYWFTRALQIHPASKFVAKVEDDSIVHYDGLLDAILGRGCVRACYIPSESCSKMTMPTDARLNAVLSACQTSITIVGESASCRVSFPHCPPNSPTVALWAAGVVASDNGRKPISRYECVEGACVPQVGGSFASQDACNRACPTPAPTQSSTSKWIWVATGVGAVVFVVICVLLWWFMSSSGRDDTREGLASPVDSTAAVQRGYSTGPRRATICPRDAVG